MTSSASARASFSRPIKLYVPARPIWAGILSGARWSAFFICRNRLLKPPRIPEGGAEVYIKTGVTKRVESDCFLEQWNGFFRPACVAQTRGITTHGQTPHSVQGLQPVPLQQSPCHTPFYRYRDEHNKAWAMDMESSMARAFWAISIPFSIDS